jgi:hypothetical protein
MTVSYELCHHAFNIKYIVPSSRLHVKTFGLYVVGRELKVMGRLVNFDMALHMAVVVVSSLLLFMQLPTPFDA